MQTVCDESEQYITISLGSCKTKQLVHNDATAKREGRAEANPSIKRITMTTSSSKTDEMSNRPSRDFEHDTARTSRRQKSSHTTHCRRRTCEALCLFYIAIIAELHRKQRLEDLQCDRNTTRPSHVAAVELETLALCNSSTPRVTSAKTAPASRRTCGGPFHCLPTTYCQRGDGGVDRRWSAGGRLRVEHSTTLIGDHAITRARVVLSSVARAVNHVGVAESCATQQ